MRSIFSSHSRGFDAMMTGYTQVMRFSREVEEGVEWFCAQWVAPGTAGAQQRRHFPHVSRFRSWLVDEQAYGEHEADALIEQLRRNKPPTPDTRASARPVAE